MKYNYDLEKRTSSFARQVIITVKEIRVSIYNQRIIPQLVASSGSIGANYCEANEAESKKDFVHKVSICKKEAKETILWLNLLATSNPEAKSNLNLLLQESHELLLIFSKIVRSSRVSQL